MRFINGLLGLSRELEKSMIEMETYVPPVILTQCAKVIKKKVRSIYGTTKLASLSDYTQIERVEAGYSANQPLLRDGKLLRDSIKTERPFAKTIMVGSPELIHAYHEYGYMNARTNTPVPARPVFKIAAAESEPDIAYVTRETMDFLTHGMNVRGMLKDEE